ncbi:hypothetical protein HK104_003746 [Borealophlyctis nickersoniae]|nr:hypothetical protein HK104_003746 [Borealophlyctis nickersoniae]
MLYSDIPADQAVEEIDGIVTVTVAGLPPPIATRPVAVAAPAVAATIVAVPAPAVIIVAAPALAAAALLVATDKHALHPRSGRTFGIGESVNIVERFEELRRIPKTDETLLVSVDASFDSDSNAAGIGIVIFTVDFSVFEIAACVVSAEKSTDAEVLVNTCYVWGSRNVGAGSECGGAEMLAPGQNAIIGYDCEAARQAVQDEIGGTTASSHLAAARKKLRQSKFVWLPAHTNIYSNELADRLAKAAMKRERVRLSGVQPGS